MSRLLKFRKIVFSCYEFCKPCSKKTPFTFAFLLEPSIKSILLCSLGAPVYANNDVVVFSKIFYHAFGYSYIVLKIFLQSIKLIIWSQVIQVIDSQSPTCYVGFMVTNSDHILFLYISYFFRRFVHLNTPNHHSQVK